MEQWVDSHTKDTQVAHTTDPTWGLNTLWIWESKRTGGRGDGCPRIMRIDQAPWWITSTAKWRTETDLTLSLWRTNLRMLQNMRPGNRLDIEKDPWAIRPKSTALKEQVFCSGCHIGTRRCSRSAVIL
jgi:hypothetical protein